VVAAGADGPEVAGTVGSGDPLATGAIEIEGSGLRDGIALGLTGVVGEAVAVGLGVAPAVAVGVGATVGVGVAAVIVYGLVAVSIGLQPPTRRLDVHAVTW
jgi:hypothetical protein